MLDKNLKVYISGPMTDKETGRVSRVNIAAFVRANSLLKKEGFKRVVSPTRVWVCKWPWMYSVLEWLFGKTGAYKLTLLYDMWLMLRCDVIYKIPGWKDSRGAQMESCVAYHFGLWVLPSKVRERVDRRLSRAMEKYVERLKVMA